MIGDCEGGLVLSTSLHDLGIMLTRDMILDADYERGVEALAAVEKEVLAQQNTDVKQAGTTGAGRI